MLSEGQKANLKVGSEKIQAVQKASAVYRKRLAQIQRCKSEVQFRKACSKAEEIHTIWQNAFSEAQTFIGDVIAEEI